MYLRYTTKQSTLQEPCVNLPCWHKAGTEALSDYYSGTNIDLEKLINTDITSLQDIDTFNTALIEILSSNSTKYIPTSKHNAHTKPGWTKAVKDLHAVEQAMGRRWIREGRSRGMEYASFGEYKRAKPAFRNVHDT